MILSVEPELFRVSNTLENKWMITHDGNIIAEGDTEMDAVDMAIAKISALNSELRHYKNAKIGLLQNAKVTRESV